MQSVTLSCGTCSIGPQDMRSTHMQGELAHLSCDTRSTDCQLKQAIHQFHYQPLPLHVKVWCQFDNM